MCVRRATRYETTVKCPVFLEIYGDTTNTKGSDLSANLRQNTLLHQGTDEDTKTWVGTRVEHNTSGTSQPPTSTASGHGLPKHPTQLQSYHTLPRTSSRGMTPSFSEKMPLQGQTTAAPLASKGPSHGHPVAPLGTPTSQCSVRNVHISFFSHVWNFSRRGESASIAVTMALSCGGGAGGSERGDSSSVAGKSSD